MPLYLLTKDADYDEYDACLIRARSPKVAIAIADDEYNPRSWHDDSTWANAECKHITISGKERGIIASFLAG